MLVFKILDSIFNFIRNAFCDINFTIDNLFLGHAQNPFFLFIHIVGTASTELPPKKCTTEYVDIFIYFYNTIQIYL